MEVASRAVRGGLRAEDVGSQTGGLADVVNYLLKTLPL